MSGRCFPGGYFPPGYFPQGYFPGGCDAGGYNIYRGVATINYNTPVGYVPPGADTVDLVGLRHAANAEYFYGVRCISSAGVEETNSDRIVRVIVDDERELIGPAPNQITWATITPAADGKMTVDYRYNSAGQPGVATQLQVAEVTAGVPDWDNVIDTVSIGVWSFVTTSFGEGWSHGATVTLAVRAITAAGSPGETYLCAAAVADSEGPPAVTYMEASQHDG